MGDVLHKVADLSITVAPILAVYLLQSRFTLQVWKAAHHVPPPPHSHSAASDGLKDEVKKAKSDYRFDVVLRIIVLNYLLCTAIAGYVIAEVDSDEKKRSDPRFVNPYLFSLLFPFSYTIMNFISIISGRCERILFRREDQKLFVISKRSKTWSYLNDLFIYIIGSVIVSGAIFLPSKLLASLIGASIVFDHPLSDVLRRFSAKGLILSSLGMALFPLYLFVPTLFGEVNHAHRILSRDIILFDIDWPSLILGSMLHSGPLQFIASYCRLDFADARNGDTPRTELARTGAPGITVPFTFPWPSTRSSPYFFSALAGWVCTVVIVARRLEVVTYANVGFYVAFISPLVMTVAVACTAVRRGEARKVWSYEEDWGFANKETEPKPAAAGMEV